MASIKVTSEELHNVSNQLSSAATSISGESQRAMTQVEGLVGAGWEGAASQQFNQLFMQWKQGADQLQEALTGISQLLGGAGRTYEQTEEAIRASMSN